MLLPEVLAEALQVCNVQLVCHMCQMLCFMCRWSARSLLTGNQELNPEFQHDGLLVKQPPRGFVQCFKEPGVPAEMLLWVADCGNFRTYWHSLATGGGKSAVSASYVILPGYTSTQAPNAVASRTVHTHKTYCAACAGVNTIHTGCRSTL